MFLNQKYQHSTGKSIVQRGVSTALRFLENSVEHKHILYCVPTLLHTRRLCRGGEERNATISHGSL